MFNSIRSLYGELNCYKILYYISKHFLQKRLSLRLIPRTLQQFRSHKTQPNTHIQKGRHIKTTNNGKKYNNSKAKIARATG